MSRQLFVNLSVKDLQTTKAFFEALGLRYDNPPGDDAGHLLRGAVDAMLGRPGFPR